MANEVTTIYNVGGQEIKLNATIVRKMIVKSSTPDKVSDEEIGTFIAMCKFNELNPFTREAYLTSYTSKTGVVNTTMIISKEAYLKRADNFPEYEGFDAGIIVRTGDGKIEERVGTFYVEGEVLVGGWAKAFRNGRRPVEVRISFKEYNTGQSLWAAKPATMIRKVAIVQALREAFPSQLSAMYTKEEAGIEDADYTEIKNEPSKPASAPRTAIPAMPTEGAQAALPAAGKPAAGKPDDDDAPF